MKFKTFSYVEYLSIKFRDLVNSSVYTNAFLKTTVRNNVFVLDFILHYLLHVSAPIGGHLQVICTQNTYILR
jgi:hypothetical protein